MLAHSPLSLVSYLFYVAQSHAPKESRYHLQWAGTSHISYHLLGDMATDQSDLSNSSPEIPLDDLALRRSNPGLHSKATTLSTTEPYLISCLF